MENASKALLIGAGVLIAVMIISLATTLFRSASGVAKTYDQTMQSTEVTQFNTNFTKYLDAGVQDENGTTTRESANIYDVISVANFAKNYNQQVVEDPETSDDPIVVKVDLASKDGTKLQNVQNLSMKAQNHLVDKCYYKNNDEPNAYSTISFKISIDGTNATGRINHVTFTADFDISSYLNDTAGL